MPKRLEIGYTYLDLCVEKYPERPTHQDLATQAKISKSYEGILSLSSKIQDGQQILRPQTPRKGARKN
jgi:hypothetical protein